MTRADTIARHINATTLCATDKRLLNAAFLECLGGAAVAGEAAGKAPSPPKPAGWVVRDDHAPHDAQPYFGRYGWRSTVSASGPYDTRTEAVSARDGDPDYSVLPVDAAGNVIEAEDIGATLRREECERKAARQSGVAWEAARAGEEAERLRGELAAVRVERDALNAAEADLRHALRAIAGCVGGAVSLGASTEMHCAVADEVRAAADEVRAVVGQLRAERDALAAEVQRAKEQKPVHLALVNEQGAVVDGYLIKTRALAEDDARRRACTVAPLYLAPPLRDVSGVIAQCEEALREWDREGPRSASASSLVAVTLTKARNALRGAS